MRKTLLYVIGVAAVAGVLGLAWIAGVSDRANSAGHGGLVAAKDGFGRSFEVSAQSCIVDEDRGAIIIRSGTNTLRFEKDRLLLDGYVRADLTSEMRRFRVYFADKTLSVVVHGVELVGVPRETRDFAVPGQVD